MKRILIVLFILISYLIADNTLAIRESTELHGEIIEDTVISNSIVASVVSNDTGTNMVYEYISGGNKAKYFKEGSLITVPFEGWFFSVPSTKRMLIAIRTVEKQEKEIMSLNAQIEAYKRVNDYYKLQFEVMEVDTESLRKNAKVSRAVKTGLLTGGFVLGVGITVASFIIVNNVNGLKISNITTTDGSSSSSSAMLMARF